MNKQELINLAKQKLNPTEMSIFQLMLPQSGVVFLKGKPGTAKSAVLESIANKLDMVYIRMDLTTKDEVDIGLYPYLRKEENGYSTVSHAVPDWAEMTTDKTRNYMIVFEEPNRAKNDIRNAALGLMNEGRIGHSFKFSSNVYMAAAGNMGEEDGTDVEELDTAQSSRLINYPWEMDLLKWREMYADANVHPDILKFLDHKPSAFYPKDQQEGVHVCPRTWTNLSKLLEQFHGKNSDIDEYGDLLMNSGKYHVGTFAVEMYKFLSDTKRLTVKRLLEGKFKTLDKFTRENRQEVANEIKELNLLDLKNSEIANIKKLLISFKVTQDEDALMGMLHEVVFGIQKTGVYNNRDTDPKSYERYKEIIKSLIYPEFEREKNLIATRTEAPKKDEQV